MKVQRDITFKYGLVQDRNYTALRSMTRMSNSTLLSSKMSTSELRLKSSHFLRNYFYYSIF